LRSGRVGGYAVNRSKERQINVEVQIKLTIRPGCEVTLRAANPREAVTILAAYQETLGAYVCGNCSANVGAFESPPRYIHRKDTENHDYFSIECPSCQFRMDFGQHKVGDTLFAKRDKGWYDWREFSKRQGGEQGQTAGSGQPRPVDDKELAEFT